MDGWFVYVVYAGKENEKHGMSVQTMQNHDFDIYNVTSCARGPLERQVFKVPLKLGCGHHDLHGSVALVGTAIPSDPATIIMLVLLTNSESSYKPCKLMVYKRFTIEVQPLINHWCVW